MGERIRRWTLVGLCELAFVLRAVGLDSQSLWRDEVDAVRFASRPLSDLFQSFATPGENGPLYYFLLRPWLELAGESEFALRFFSLVLGVMAVPLIYRLARRLFPSLPFVALVAALLAATSPYLVWYSQEGKMYTLVVLLILLSMESFLAAVERGGWHRWLVYVIVTGAAFYVHLIAVLIVPAQAMVILILGRQGRNAAWKPWLVSLAALTIPYLPLLGWQLPLLLQPAETGFRFVLLHEMFASLLQNYSLGVAHGATLWAVAPFVGVLLAVGLVWVDHESYRVSLVLLLGWLLIPVIGLFLVSLARPLYTARYLIFVLPAYLILVAAVVVTIARRSPLLAGLVLIALLAINGWGVWLQARTPLKADFRGATRYLTGHMAPEDLILFQIPYGRHSFEYYTRRQAVQQRQIHQQSVGPVSPTAEGSYQLFLPLMAGGGEMPYRWAEGLYTNAGMDPDEANHRMLEMLAGSRIVWLVATEVSMWDERGLVQAWLAGHGTLTDEAQFVRVSVYRYRLP